MSDKQPRISLFASVLFIAALSSSMLVRNSIPLPVASVTALLPVEWPVCGAECSGENVTTIQLLLLAHGEAAPLNSIFDEATTSAVKAFQMTANLPEGGIVDQNTWPALLISIDKGVRGLAVVALQRQLDTHGAKIVPAGKFDQQTLEALKSYQQGHTLKANGSADLETWNSLVTTPDSIQLPPPPPFPDGPTLWGVDTAPPVTWPLFHRMAQKMGKPNFIGKYLNGTSFKSLSAAEAAFIHARGAGIMLLEADFNHDTGYRDGTHLARMAISRANALDIPRGVAIFADLEPGAKVDSDWLIAWFRTILHAGYIPGYYANPYADGNFNHPFCSAARQAPDLADKAILDVYEPMMTRSPAINAPLFTPSFLYCGTDPIGRILVWQYGLSKGDRELNVDTDEMKSSVPLW